MFSSRSGHFPLFNIIKGFSSLERIPLKRKPSASFFKRIPQNGQRIPRESPANPPRIPRESPACKSPPPGPFSSSQQTYRVVFYILLFERNSLFTHECVPCRLGVVKKRSLPVQLWRVCRSLCPARAMVTVQLCASGARSFGKSVAASVALQKREPTRQFHAQAANIEFLVNSAHALPQPHC